MIIKYEDNVKSRLNLNLWCSNVESVYKFGMNKWIEMEFKQQFIIQQKKLIDES